MSEDEIRRELYACGMAFFVEYFDRFNKLDWYCNRDIETAKDAIAEELKYKRRPDGGDYTLSGLNIRFSSLFMLFSQGVQWEALNIIAKAGKVSPKVKMQAQELLQEAQLRAQQRQAAEAREEMRREQEIERLRKAKLEEERLKEQKQAERHNLEMKILALREEQNAQLRIIEENKSFFPFGKKAALRTNAKKRLLELDEELKAVESLIRQIL